MKPTDYEPLPIPPPFMFGCGECTELLVTLGERVGMDGTFIPEQIAIAKHIVTAHPEEVPPPHTRRCGQCPKYAVRPDAADRWAEHRARDLFLPETIARLL
ncbi:hypothetical protein ABZ471_15375 [Streptomyces sp. NPDC005728]|uniref:hypothetical protein n=1 Tax=Streptomyces sp. NPDC005728 TaxID=3157054 RepID=UPI0033DDB734